MTQGGQTGADAACVHCGSALRANAPFCGSCGQAVTNRQPTVAAPISRSSVIAHPPPQPSIASNQIIGAGRGVRCCCYLLDLAAMLSPALPLAIAGALLGVPEIVYIVVPIAFVAVWAWMQIWQGFTGMSFGKSMLGLRLVRAADRQPPGLAATLTRSSVFAATAGLVAIPVIASEMPHEGPHDRMTGLTMIDVTKGANPLGQRQQTVLRSVADRSLNKVSSPIPLGSSGRR